MANNLSDYGENQLLVYQLTATAQTRPTAWYVALGTANTDTGLTEISTSNGYARQAVTFSVTGDTATNNNGTLTFGPCSTSDWGTVTSVAVFDASTSGNCLWVGALTASKAIAVGDSLTIAAGALTLTLA